MSMRDLFVKKGLVSEKRAKEVDRALKEVRKAAQAQKRGKHELELEARREREAAQAAALEARRVAAEAAAAQRAAHEHSYRIQQIVRSHRLGGRGPVPFAVRVPASTRVITLWLPEGLARDLRAGRAAVVAMVEQGAWACFPVSGSAAEKLESLAPGALVHWVKDTSHFADPAQGLMQRSWESTLGPHRVLDASELRRFQAPR